MAANRMAAAGSETRSGRAGRPQPRLDANSTSSASLNTETTAIARSRRYSWRAAGGFRSARSQA